MMTAPKDDAFPRDDGSSVGLSKREYFAAHAPIVPLDGNSFSRSVDTRAEMAVEWADALIVELNK